MSQVEALIQNEWIEECGGPWGSIIVLAAKNHNVNVTNIENFIRRMCISYRKFNEITKPF